jgi:hypothetical protein
MSDLVIIRLPELSTPMPSQATPNAALSAASSPQRSMRPLFVVIEARRVKLALSLLLQSIKRSS